MRKVFISTVSMQNVKEYKYKSDIYPESTITAYPITISFENNCSKGDKALMLTIVTHTAERNIAEINYVTFTNQVKELAQKIGVDVEFLEIPVSPAVNHNAPQKLYKSLISVLKEDDEIYADITYGFKYNPIVIFAALNYAYQTKSGVDIQEICYGNLYDGTPLKQDPKPELFDVTSLFYMNSISNLAGMAQLGGDIDLIPLNE